MSDSRDATVRVHVVDAPGKWLHGDELHVCVVQTRPPSAEMIASDASRVAAVAALRDLLDGPHPILGELVAGGLPSVVVLPEYALGSGDWASVDAMVSSYPFPLILVAGFGATLGKTLDSWISAAGAGCKEPSSTERLLGWPDSEPVALSRRYNCGWCWVHPDSTHTSCVTFTKGFPEQHHEIGLLPEIASGLTIVCLKADDLLVFPLICSDLLHHSVSGADSLARIGRAMSERTDRRPAMILGLLYQLSPWHEMWRNSIDRACRTAAGLAVVVSLVNHAVDCCARLEVADRWRTLTGVYASGLHQRECACLPTARVLHDPGFTGVLVRETDALIAAGPVRWSEGPLEGRYLWRPGQRRPISQDGRVGTPRVTSAHGVELCRFARRSQPASGSADDPIVGRGLSRVIRELGADIAPDSATLVSRILDGVASERRASAIHADALHEVEVSLRSGLRNIGVLMESLSVTWQGDPSLAGQLTESVTRTHLLVWSDPNRHCQEMQRELESWVVAPGTHAPLIVLGAGTGGELSEGIVLPNRHTDIVQAPPGEWRDITTPRGLRSVRCIRVGRLENCYIPDGIRDAASAVRELISQWLPGAA